MITPLDSKLLSMPTRSPMTDKEIIYLILEAHVNLNELYSVTISPNVYDVLIEKCTRTGAGTPLTQLDREKRWRPIRLPLDIWVTLSKVSIKPYMVIFTTMSGKDLHMNLEDYLDAS